MNQLLNWAVENSNGEPTNPNNLKDLDPEIIDAILGKDEATLMKEAMQGILNKEAGLENREIAFDNLEMLVEHIDNAKNLQPLKLWEPLLDLLKDEEASIRKYAAWVIGTATQNNPDAQKSFVEHKGFEKVIQALESETIVDNLKKIIYCLSCSIRHDPDSLTKFQSINGFQILHSKLISEDVSVKSRIIFMLTSLVADEESVITPLHQLGTIAYIADLLLPTSPHHTDDDIIDKGLHFLNATLPTLNNLVKLENRAELLSQIQKLEPSYTDMFSQEEWALLKQNLS